MIISASQQSSIQPVSSAYSQASGTHSTEAVKSSDSVQISKEGLNAMQKWQDIANKYDVNNITTDERLKMTTELVEAGLVSTEVGLHLAAPRSINEGPNDRSDFLTEMKASLAFDRAHSSAEHIRNKTKAINILEQLKSLRG